MSIKKFTPSREPPYPPSLPTDIPSLVGKEGIVCGEGEREGEGRGILQRGKIIFVGQITPTAEMLDLQFVWVFTSAMPKIKKKPLAFDVPPATEETKPEVQPEREEPGYRVNGREGPQDGGAEKRSAGTVAIKLTEDGAADPGTRENTWKKLSEMIAKTPGARTKIFGGREESVLISPEQVKPFYSGIGLLNTFLAIRLMKMDAQVAGAIVPYSPDELDLLSRATADAVNENLDKCPKWLIELLQGGGSVALAKLAMVFFQVHAQKLAAVKAAMSEPRPERAAAVN